MAEPLERTTLRHAFALIEDKRRWTRFELARTPFGDGCSPTDKEARAWCALGAILKCAYDLVPEEKLAERLAHRALKREDIHWTHMYWVNDIKGHIPTLVFFQKVIGRQLKFGERKLVMPDLMQEHHTPLREARERERVRRGFMR